MEETRKNQGVFVPKRSLLLQLVGEMPLFKIIDFLLENKGMDFDKTDIAEGAGISRTSLFNYWAELEKHGIVKVTRKYGKTKLYTLDVKSIITQKLLELEKALIMDAMEKDQKKGDQNMIISA